MNARRAVFRPVDRDALARASKARPARAVDEAELTTMLRAALRGRPLHIAFVPAQPGENSIDEKDAMENPVVHNFLACHSRTTDDSPDFHAITQKRPPLIGIAMATQVLRGNTLPAILADVIEGGVATTYRTDTRLPIQSMAGYEILAVARGPVDRRSLAVSYLEEVAAVYHAVPTDVLYHADDSDPTGGVSVTLIFEMPETLLDELAPGLRGSLEYQNWFNDTEALPC